MSVIENLDVVMGAQTAELDAAVAKEIKNLDNLKKAATGGATLDVKGFKDMGKLTKSTAEFGGVLGQLAGDSQIGQIGQMIGGISEKVSQFSEVSQAGSAGALAFKAGLVGLVAAGSFNVGTMIGEWWADTKKWTDELSRVRNEFEQIGAATRALQMRQFANQMKDFKLIGDPHEQELAHKEMFNRLAKEYDDLQAKHEAMIKQRDGMSRRWYQSAMDFSLQRNNATTQANEVAEQMKMISQQRMALWELIDPRNAELKKMEEAKQKEQEMANIRKAANDQLGQLRKRYDELTLGKDKARENEMRELGLSEGAIGREMNMRKMIEEREKAAGKLKKDEEEAKRIKEDSLSADEKLLQQAERLHALKEQGLITDAEFQKQLAKAEESTREVKPEYKGAVSAQAGSVEAYKLLLERERGAINEAIKQTAIQERMAAAMDTLAKNMKGIRTIGAAR